MERSAEFRWFFRAAPPRPLVDWFERTADRPATRSDVYLVLPGTDALGVKIRGGTTSFELKLRPRPPEPRPLPGGTTGQLEEWQRWSFSRSGLSRLFPRLGLPKARWLEVSKRRRRTTIPFRRESGCRVELTTVAARGQEWTTVGFESFGPAHELVPALEAAAETVLASVHLAAPLGADLSCGYPGWLATL